MVYNEIMDQKDLYIVKADWDKQTQRWTATSDDITGLILESDTIEELLGCIDDVAA